MQSLMLRFESEYLLMHLFYIEEKFLTLFVIAKRVFFCLSDTQINTEKVTSLIYVY